MKRGEDDFCERPPPYFNEGNARGYAKDDDGEDEPEPCLEHKIKQRRDAKTDAYIDELAERQRAHDLVFGLYKLRNLELHVLIITRKTPPRITGAAREA